jgi:hypothetical protein
VEFAPGQATGRVPAGLWPASAKSYRKDSRRTAARTIVYPTTGRHGFGGGLENSQRRILIGMPARVRSRHSDHAGTGTPRTLEADRPGPRAALPNRGASVSVGTRRRSSLLRSSGPMDPNGRVLNFISAAILIKVRNRSKDLRRSISVEGTVRPAAASNASFETVQLIRRMPSRISKRMWLLSAGETAFNVLPIMHAFHHSVGRARRRPRCLRLADSWRCRGCLRRLHRAVRPLLPSGHPVLLFPPARKLEPGFCEQSPLLFRVFGCLPNGNVRQISSI